MTRDIRPSAGHPDHPVTPPPTAASDHQATGLRPRHDGWTAERQRLFLDALASTGSVGAAARTAGITARSAYRLRNHAQGERFAAAWDAALMKVSNRLVAVAFERALSGTPRQIRREGRVIGEVRTPSDPMLMFLLRHLNPLFSTETRVDWRLDQIDELKDGYGRAMDALVDADCAADLLGPVDETTGSSGDDPL